MEFIISTIKARKEANGSTRYIAIVRIRRGTTELHQESRTFTHRTEALSWARHREVALEEPAALNRQRHGMPTLAELIHWYIEAFETISRWQRSKQTHLEFLERHSLGKLEAFTLTCADLIRHVQSRRVDGAGPATALNDLIWVGVVLRAAKSVKQLPVRPEIGQQARTACRELRLVGKPRKRTRPPTSEDLKRLREYFNRRDRRATVPMLAFMDIAIASARQESEIRRLEWRDNNTATRTGMVSDVKHPTAKDRNHRRFKSKAEARMALFEWIEGWYSRHRRHSSIGRLSPNNFEEGLLAGQDVRFQETTRPRKWGTSSSWNNPMKLHVRHCDHPRLQPRRRTNDPLVLTHSETGIPDPFTTPTTPRQRESSRHEQHPSHRLLDRRRCQ